MALNENDHLYDHYWKRDTDHRSFAPSKKEDED